MTTQRIPRPTDARALRSREALRTALLRLIEQKPFEQISIRDITAEAGVSYPVFFRQFNAKERLLEDIATGEIRKLISLAMPLFEADGEQSGLFSMCDYVNDHRALWKTLLTAGASAAMREEFINIANEIVNTRGRANPWLPTDLAAPFVIGGIFEILAWWLRQPDDYPVENVVKIMDALVVRSTVHPVDIQLA